MSTHSDHSPGERRSRTIREVLDLLAGEFPDVTVSKIRFLESRGLIRPERTASGYRKFDDNDVERLRWILRQQRENFLPLKVIKGRLEQGAAVAVAPSLFDDDFSANDDGLDEVESSASRHPSSSGFEPDPIYGDELGVEPLENGARPIEPDIFEEKASAEPPEPTPNRERAVMAATEQKHKPTEASDGSRRGRTARKSPSGRTAADGTPAWSADELAHACSVDVRTVNELDEYGLLDGEGKGDARIFRRGAGEIVKLAVQIRAFGVEARHLRTFKHAAERDAGVIAQVITPMLHLRNPEARRRAGASLTDLKGLGAALHEAFLSASLDDLERT